jgi:hypothetical protein
LLTLTLLVLAGMGIGVGCGALLGSVDGLILGGTVGFVAGVSLWYLATTYEYVQHERRLNRYFTDNHRDPTHDRRKPPAYPG